MTFLDVAPRQTEKQFMGQVIRLAEVFGWKVYHCYDSRRSAAGFPDLVMIRRPRVIFLEAKSERGRATSEQLAWIAALRDCGQECYIVRPSDWDKLERILRR